MWWQRGWGGEQCEWGRWGGQRGRDRGGGQWGWGGRGHWLDCEMIGMRAQVVRAACKHRAGTRTCIGMSFDMQSAVSFLSSLTTHAWVPTCQAPIKKHPWILILWLVCLNVAVTLRVMRPTSSDARLGGGWMLSCKPLYFVFLKALRTRLRRSGVSTPLHLPSTL